jgi:hypothetical protein
MTGHHMRGCTSKGVGESDVACCSCAPISSKWRQPGLGTGLRCWECATVYFCERYKSVEHGSHLDVGKRVCVALLFTLQLWCSGAEVNWCTLDLVLLGTPGIAHATVELIMTASERHLCHSSSSCLALRRLLSLVLALQGSYKVAFLTRNCTNCTASYSLEWQ